MAFEELINEELKYARYEYQIKFKANITESVLLKLGARKLRRYQLTILSQKVDKKLGFT